MWFREIWKEDELITLDAQKNSISAELENAQEFRIEPHHIQLASRIDITFGADYDVCYEGIFCTDDKRPFGNKPWDQDIAIEMGEKTQEEFSKMDLEEYKAWYKENYFRMYRVFQETKIVMQIALTNMASPIRFGTTYKRGLNSKVWSEVRDPS